MTMKGTLRKSTCIISCAFLLFAVGCHQADYAEDEQKKAEETIEIEEGVEIPGESIEYSSILWKSWIVDETVNGSDKFGFIITKVNGNEIEGVIVIGDDAGWYWIWSERCRPFKGIITGNQAKCTFQYEDCQAETVFTFQENDRIEARVKCDQQDIDMNYLFRPYHFTDKGVPLNDDLSSASVYLETWGEVNLISATIDDNHSYPIIFIADKEGNILYEDSCINGFVYWDIFVEDLNQDGRQDMWTVVLGDVEDGLQEGSLVDVFYQTGDGRFYHPARTIGDGLPEKYFGEYMVTRFCPTKNYEDIRETVLTQEEVEEMIGKKIVIQEKLLATYDSERRQGIREDRKEAIQESMIIEVRNTFPEYHWDSVSADLENREKYSYACPNERLCEAVGEEYYAKINGAFYDIYSEWQQFYTLEGEDKLIMHSMLTGQNFILEKEQTHSDENN